MSKTILEMKEYPFANRSRLKNPDAKMVVFDNSDKSNTIEYTNLRSIVNYLGKGDVIIVNDSGVLPASFQMVHIPSGINIEIRLVEHIGTTPKDVAFWKSYVFGEGDWKSKTEERPNPPELKVGDVFHLGSLEAHIIKISQQFDQLVELEFSSRFDLWGEFYKYGNLVQYSYLEDKLELWDQQTLFSSIPLSVEAPSASFQLNWEIMFQLAKKGVQIIPITHAISLSSTGNEKLDTQLPFPEKYWISEVSARKINAAKKDGNRIIAFGTSAMRAVESSVNNGIVQPGWGRSNLKITECTDRQIFTGILTGMHVPGESHLELLTNFIDEQILENGYQGAVEKGFLWHEYGDLSLILV